METEQLFRSTGESSAEETTEALISAKNFQDEVRQWFTAMLPEERAAALGFQDDFVVMAAFMARMAALSSSTAPHKTKNNNDDNDGSDDLRSSFVTIIDQQQPAPTSRLPPIRTTDKLFTNGT